MEALRRFRPGAPAGRAAGVAGEPREGAREERAGDLPRGLNAGGDEDAEGETQTGLDAGDELGGGHREEVPEPQARARQSVEPGTGTPPARPLELVAEGMGGGPPLVPGLAGRQSLVAVVEELEQRRQEVLIDHALRHQLEGAGGRGAGAWLYALPGSSLRFRNLLSMSSPEFITVTGTIDIDIQLRRRLHLPLANGPGVTYVIESETGETPNMKPSMR